MENIQMNRSAFVGLVAAALAVPAFAAPLNSGLKSGERVSPFHPKHLAGPLAGTTNCFPCTFQNRPQVQVWVNGDDAKNIVAIGKSLNKAMETHKDKEFKALVVFLTTPKTAAKVEATVKSAAKMPELSKIGMALLNAEDDAVEMYKVNTSADVKNTVFVYKNWQVAQNFVNLKGDAKGLESLNTAIAGITK
jgi:hypothetical protein